MRIFNELGGFSLGEADGLRKVKSLEQYRDRFVNGCISNGMSISNANELFDRFDLGYSFNKSHACAYGKISAICCWLLAYYPKEFLASSMTLELTQAEPDINGFVKEANKIGINILPPDINISIDEFYPDIDGIRFPLNVISFIGDSAYKSILKFRPFNSFSDFINKVPKKNVKKNAVINLIKAGCFDNFNGNRSLLLSDYYNSRNEDVQVYFWCDDVQIIYETEVFGFTLGKHPLDGQINKDISDFKENEVINIVGIITNVREHTDKNKNKMVFLKLENKSCEYEGIIFSYNYSKLSNLCHIGAKLGLEGKKQNKTVLINNAWRL